MLIKEMTLHEIYGFDDQIRRNFDLRPQGSITSSVEQYLSKNHGEITPTGMAGIAASSMQLRTHGDNIRMVNGWAAKRFRVYIKIELDNHSGLQCTRNFIYVMGYTDRIDISHGDHIAPDMRIYINKIVGVTETELMDHGRLTVKHRRRDSLSVLNGVFDFKDRSKSDYIIRPDTVFRSRHFINNSSRYLEGRDDDFYPNDHSKRGAPKSTAEKNTTILQDLVESNSSFLAGPALAESTDVVPSRFIHKMMKSDIAAKREHDLSSSPSSNLLRDPMAASRDMYAADEASADCYIDTSENQFMAALRIQSNYQEEGFCEFGDLAVYHRTRSLAGLDDDTVVYFAGGVSNPYDISRELDEEQTVGWASALPTTVIAAELCQSLPAIMDDMLLVQAHISANNHSRTGETMCRSQAVVSYIRNEGSLTQLQRRLEDTFVREIFRKISHNGEFLVDIDVFCDTNSIIRVEIQVGGGRTEILKFPAWASSELTSMKSRGAEPLANIAYNYNVFRTEIDDTMATMRTNGVQMTDNQGRDILGGDGTFDINSY